MRLVLVSIVLLNILLIWPNAASSTQSTSPRGICDGQICGPAESFTVETFPTIANVDFSKFPDNPSELTVRSENGREWFVSPQGNDNDDGTEARPLATIDYAVKLAQSGDLIRVMDGIYAIGGEEYEAITLAQDNITLVAMNMGQVILHPAHDINAIGLNIIGDGVVVDGFVLENFRAYGLSFGRLDTPQKNLVLRHLIVDGSEDGIRSTVADTTPNPTPVIEGLLLYDVWIRNITNVGFNCGEGPCNHVRLEALKVEMSGGDGENSGADAVAIENGDNLVVFNADISGASADGLDFKVTRVAIANVVVHDVMRNGIKLWHDGDVINALVTNTGADAAIVFDGGGDYRLLHCVVARHAMNQEAYAMTVAYDHPDEQGNLQVINSIFYENSGPLWISPAFTLDIRYSIFYGSPSAEVAWGEIFVGDIEAGYLPMNTLEEADGGCCNIGLIDPLFVAPDEQDFHLQAASLARNAGVISADYVPFDLFGLVRGDGNPPDLGVFESPPN